MKALDLVLWASVTLLLDLPRLAMGAGVIRTAKPQQLVLDGARYSERGGVNGKGGVIVSQFRRRQALRRVGADPLVARLARGEIVEMKRGTVRVQWMSDVTVTTGREVGLFRLADRRRVLVMGNSNTTESPPDAVRIIAHTHPSGLLNPSGRGDFLNGPQGSTVVIGPNGGVARFCQRDEDAFLARWIQAVRATRGDIQAALRQVGYERAPR
jgi:hypothetical protein